jgi:GapR-like, DNA-binding domain
VAPQAQQHTGADAASRMVSHRPAIMPFQRGCESFDWPCLERLQRNGLRTGCRRLVPKTARNRGVKEFSRQISPTRCCDVAGCRPIRPARLNAQSDLMKEVEGQGFDKKIFRIIIKRRRMGKDQCDEEDTLVALYERALEEAAASRGGARPARAREKAPAEALL